MGKALRESFTPEFLGRLDAVVQFKTLSPGAMEAIAGKYLEQLRRRTQAMGIQLQLPQELGKRLCARCGGKDGARQLRRLVQTQVEGPLASFLLRCGRKPARVKGRIEEAQVVFY